MVVNGKRVIIIGAGKTGIAAAIVSYSFGAEVLLCDIKPKTELVHSIKRIESMPIKTLFGAYPEVKRDNTDLIIISPGVPNHIPPIEKAVEENIPVWSEIELAYRMFEAPILAVTGTNGKTTTTTLLGELFKGAGKPVIIAGNIGIPLIKRVKDITSKHVVALEISSFQLEFIETFRPKVAMILNITPDHLDRHSTFDSYIEAKKKIFKNQKAEDYSILNYDDPNVRGMSQYTCGKVVFFSLKQTLSQGTYLKDDNLDLKLNGRENLLCSRSDIFIRGDHNIQNILAAAAAAAVMGLDLSSIKDTLRNFKGVEHRLEFVDEINGVRFFNDSKATNPEASIHALKAFDEPLILIAGGKSKGSDFTEFVSALKEKQIKSLILLGETSDKIYKAARKKLRDDDIIRVDSLETAVKQAYKIASPGDIVLLSPACASWDMFNNYEERGNLFKEKAVSLRELP